VRLQLLSSMHASFVSFSLSVRHCFGSSVTVIILDS
jgi:hypothetical protein